MQPYNDIPQNGSDPDEQSSNFPHEENAGPDPLLDEMEREFQEVRDSDGEPRTDGMGAPNVICEEVRDGEHLDHSDVILVGEIGEFEPDAGDSGRRCPLCGAVLDPEFEGGSQFLECPTGDYKYNSARERSYSRPHGNRGGGR